VAERTVAVRLIARVDAYTASMAKASAATGAFSASSQRNLLAVGTQMQHIGRKATTWLSLPIVAAGAFAVKAASDWESAWAGVTKTVDGTAAQMAELESGLRDMAKELPATHEEIAAVAEAAGALGVATPDIEQFTKVMIDLGETTNLTADEAATSIAQLMNVMQTSPGDVDNLASALVHLGNTGASTESQILDMAQRIAGAGALIGLSEDEVLGFAAAMADLGINAELGGTAMQRVFLKMHTAVLEGGEALADFAEVAGMSAEQFVNVWEADPAAAVTSFIEGLGGLDAAGGNVIGTMNDLGLRGQLVQQVLLRLMGAGDDLTATLGRSADAFIENTAATDEAEKRYATFASRMEMVRNQIVDLFIDLGTMLLPTIEAIVTGVGKLAGGFQALPAPLQLAVGGFLGLVAAMGPMIFIAGSLMRNLTTLTSVFGLSATAATKLGGALGLASIAVMGGVALYGLFTEEQRKTKENTLAAAAALDVQFDSLMNAAVAAAAAGQEINAVAVAHEALSLALAEGNEQLADSAAILNISADDLLRVFGIMAADGELLTNTIYTLGRSFFDNSQQAAFLSRNWEALHSPITAIREDALAGAEAVGITSEELAVATGAVESFLDAADEQSIQDFVAAFLNARVKVGGYSAAAVAAAEAQTGLNRSIGTNAVPVYEAYAQIVANMTDAQRAEAGITAEVIEAMEAANVAISGTGDATESAASKFGMAVDTVTGLVDALQVLIDVGFDLKQISFDEQFAMFAGFGDLSGIFTRVAQSATTLGQAAQVGLVTQFGAAATAALSLGAATRSLHGDAAAGASSLAGIATVLDDVSVSGSEAMTVLDRAFDDHIDNMISRLSDLGVQGYQTVDMLDNYGDAFHRVLDPQQALIRSHDAYHLAELRFKEDLDESNLSLEDNTEAALTNRGVLMDWMDQIVEVADAQLAAGDSVEDVNTTLDDNVEHMRAAAIAAGLNTTEVDKLIDSYLNVPETVQTAIKISGEMYALNRVEELLAQYENIPPEVLTEMELIMQTQGAWAAYHYIHNYVNNSSATLDMYANTAPIWNAINAIRGATILLNLARSAEGRYVSGPMVSTLGEEGPEVVLPLNNPARMAQLLGMSQVGPKVAAALGQLVPSSGWSGGGSSGGGGGGSVVYNVNVNMPPGANGDDVVRALRQWERRRGPVPISVR
jgi:TP901 family phage tail tape measure protein